MPDIETDVLDEIGLEGLDGITLETLWLRLKRRAGFDLDTDDPLVREYLWANVIRSPRNAGPRLQFFRLPKPRPKLVIYDRYTYHNENTGTYYEVEKDIPPDIYPYHLINKKSVQGSCATFEQREDITEQLMTNDSSLAAVDKKYGAKLTIVASQEQRLISLGVMDNNPAFVMTDVVYCYLERIGRMRDLGMVTVGIEGKLEDFNAKTAFYYRKVLGKAGLIKKSVHFVHNTKPDHTVQGYVLFLSRFHQRRVSPMENAALKISDHLNKLPSKECAYLELKKELPMSKNAYRNVFGNFPHNFMLFMKDVKQDVLKQEDKKSNKKENSEQAIFVRRKFKVKYVRLIKVYSLDEAEDEEEIPMLQEEDIEDMEGMDETSVVPSFDHKKEFPSTLLADRTMLSQILMLIETNEKPDGLSSAEISTILQLKLFQLRLLLKNLVKYNLVKSHKVDQGRIKMLKYLPIHKTTEASRKVALECAELTGFESESVVNLSRMKLILDFVQSKNPPVVIGYQEIRKAIVAAEFDRPYVIDKRSVQTLIGKMVAGGKLKMLTVNREYLGRERQLEIICDPSLADNDSRIQKMKDEWKFVKSKDLEREKRASKHKANTAAIVQQILGKEAVMPLKKRKATEPIEVTAIKAKRTRRGKTIKTDEEHDDPAEELEQIVTSRKRQARRQGTISIIRHSEKQEVEQKNKSAVYTIESSGQPITGAVKAENTSRSPRRATVQRPTKKLKKNRLPAYDAVDQVARQLLKKRRVQWTFQEDNFLLLCRVTSQLLDPQGSRNICVSRTVVRDELHKTVPAALDKTAQACQRRIHYMLKDSRTVQNVAEWVAEFGQDSDFYEIERPDVPHTDEDKWNEAYLKLLRKVLAKFLTQQQQQQDTQSRDLLVTDENINHFHITVPNSLPNQSLKELYNEPKNFVDVHVSSVENILMASLHLQYNQEHSDPFNEYALFRMYQKYPDAVLRAVVRKFQSNNLIAKHKNAFKNSSDESVALKQRGKHPYKLSANYLFMLQTKFAMNDLIAPLATCPATIEDGTNRYEAAFMISLFADGSGKFDLQVPENFIILEQKGNTKAVHGSEKLSQSSRSLLAFRQHLTAQGCQMSKNLLDLLQLANFKVSCTATRTIKLNQTILDKYSDGLKAMVDDKDALNLPQYTRPLLTFIEDKKELGATMNEIIAFSGKLPTKDLNYLEQCKTIYKVGVTVTRWVHKRYIGPWIAHSVSGELDEDGKDKALLFIAKSWRKPNGDVQYKTIFSYLSAIVGHVMGCPGIEESSLISHFRLIAPSLQLFEMIELLLSLKCLSYRELNRRPKPTLFGHANDKESEPLTSKHRYYEATPLCMVYLSQIKHRLASYETANVTADSSTLSLY